MSTLGRMRRLITFDSGRPAQRAVQGSVDDELAFHLAARVDELVQRGFSREDAEREARKEFGDLQAAREELSHIDQRRVAKRTRRAWWSDLRQDTRVALRSLRSQPGFAAVVLVTMALGIGANGAIYTVVDAALLRPLPYRDPQQLVHLWETNAGLGGRSEASFPDFVDWRAYNSSFDALEGYDETNVTITGGDAPFRAQGARTTAGFLSMLGVPLVLGRSFAPGEDGPRGSPIVVISYGFWQRWFGGDPHVVGRTLIVDGANRTVIGVLPRGFLFAPAGESDLWFTIDRTAQTRGQRFNHWLRVVGRVRQGTTIEQARSDIGTLMQRLGTQYPESNAGRGIAVVPLRDEIIGQVRPTLLMLFGAVALVLLIACANVASLLLARAMTRGREMALRVALGARRGRLVRQLLAESLLLSLGGGLLGIWVAQNATRVLVGAIPENVRGSMPYLANLSTDARVLTYLTLVTITTGVAFGLIPALYASRPRFAALMSGDTRATAGTGRARLRGALVTLEIAMTVVLLVGAGLLTRSLTRLLRVDPGFDASRTLSLRIALPGGQYSPLAQQQFFENVLQQVRALPGVQTVGAIDNLPLNGGGTNTFHVDGQPEPDPARRPEAVMRAVAGDYFRALGIKLLDGRVFDARDDSAAMQAIVISEAVVRRYITSKRAVGAQIRFYAWADQPWTVIGVVGDVKTVRLDEHAPPTIYYSHLQGPANRMSIAIRSAIEPSVVIGGVRRVVSALDPALPVYAIRSMQETINSSPAVYARRYPLVLIGAFAAASLILAIVGIAGVISYSVAQRTREIGVRVALGAERRTILAMVLKQGGALALPGVVIGVVAAFIAARWLRSVLYGVSAGDPLTYSAIAALIVGVALAASYVPARRAAALDPAQVLRSE